VSVDMDKVGVVAAYSDPFCVCVGVCRELHTRTTGQNINLIVSTNSILCISWIIRCLIAIDAQRKMKFKY